MRATQITPFFPAGFPGMITSRNLANQTQGAISSDIVYLSALMFYDNTPLVNPTTYDNKNSISVTCAYKATNVDYTLKGVAGIAIFDNSATQAQKYAFSTPQNEVIQYQAGVQFTIQPLNQLISDLLAVKQGETGGLALGSILAKKIPTANDTALDAITYYAFKPTTTIPAGYIALPYSLRAIGLQTNNTFIYDGTGLQLCRVQYQGGL